MRPRKGTAVMGVPAPHSPIPPSPVSFPLAHKHTLFPSLKHVKQHPFLDSAPPFGCHLVSLLPFQTMLPERVSANSFLSACHLAFTPPRQGTGSSTGLHRTAHCPDPSISWLLDPSRSGLSLPPDLPPVLPPLQHLILLIIPSHGKFAFISVLPGLSSPVFLVYMSFLPVALPPLSKCS